MMRSDVFPAPETVFKISLGSKGSWSRMFVAKLLGRRSPQTAAQCAKLAVLKHKLKDRASMGEINIVGIDVSKNVFQLHGAAADGSVVFSKKLSRSKFPRFATSRD